MQNIPLFPLHTVLFPGGQLPLQVFEPRYVEMISTCFKSDQPFGIVLIESGHETGKAAKTYHIGTFARIIDWNTLPNGLLGITTEGQARFEILSTQVNENQSIEVQVANLPEEKDCLVGANHHRLVEILKEILPKMPAEIPVPEIDFSSGLAVANRLAEYLPIPPAIKYELLTLDTAQARLEALDNMLPKEQAIFTA